MNSGKLQLWIPMLLLIINIVLFSFTVEELIDASAPNYGGPFKLLTPVFGLISLIYIRKHHSRMNKSLIYLLQGLNCFFIFSPLAIILFFMLAFI